MGYLVWQLHCVHRIRFFSRGQLQVWARTQQNIRTEKKWPSTAPQSADPMQVWDRISNKKQLNKQKMAINLLGALHTDIHRPKTIWKFGIKKFWKFCCLWSRNKTYINYKFGIWRPCQKSLNFSIHMSRFCLCWRCTRVGTSCDPDVVLPHRAFWVQVT